MTAPIPIPPSPARRCRPRAWALLLLLAAACHSAPREENRPARGIEPTHVPALTTLRAAVEGGDDALAERMLASLRARPHGLAEEEVLDSFGRVLRGRALAKRLAFRLEARQSAPRGGGRLELVVSAPPGVAGRLNLPPADLEREVRLVSKDGLETRSASRSVVRIAKGLEWVPGGELRLPIAELPPLEVGSALAVRRSWHLVPRSGEALVDGQGLPIAHLPSADLSEIRRAAVLSEAGPSTPEDFASAVRAVLHGTGPGREELLELSLRLPEELREQALDKVSAEFDAAGAVGFEENAGERARRAGEALEPALRWLTGDRQPGSQLLAWRHWFQRRASLGQGRSDSGASGGLDLPARVATLGAQR